jgi:hypothetical protein
MNDAFSVNVSMKSRDDFISRASELDAVINTIGKPLLYLPLLL